MKSRALVLLLAALLAGGGEGEAQVTRLRLGGFGGNIGATVVADFEVGYRDSGTGTLIRVDIRNPSPDVERAAAVYLRADNSTLGGTKPVEDLLWRRDTDTEWTPLTTTDEFVYSENLVGLGDIWELNVWFRILLTWTDPAMVYGTTLTYTLVVSAP